MFNFILLCCVITNRVGLTVDGLNIQYYIYQFSTFGLLEYPAH